jgi:hypothetical protein
LYGKILWNSSDFSPGTLRPYNMMNEMKRPDIPEFFG